MRIPVVASQLLSRSNMPFGIELDSPICNTDKQIGIAGMIYKLKRPATNAAVDSFGGAELDDHNPVCSPRPFPRFAYRDTLPGELA